MYIRYVLFAVPCAVLILASFILSPLLAGLSMALRRNTLPGFLQWFSTVDDTLDGGQHQHPDKYPSSAAGWALWWQRTCWICRNPAQGWQSIPFGYSKALTVEHIEAMRMTGTPGGAPYFKYREWFYFYKNVERLPLTLFSWQRSVPLFGDTYLKLWFGWTEKGNSGRMSLKFVPISFDQVRK